MGLNSLKIATDGYLKRATKAALIIAVAGYLNYSSGPIPPTPPSTRSSTLFGSGSLGVAHKKEQVDRIIREEDDEILTIIKIFLKCQE